MIAWRELGFSREFFAGPPSMVGLEEGTEILRLQRSDGSWLPLRVAGSFFFFSEPEPSVEVVAGYTFRLGTAADATMFENYARNQARDFYSATLHLNDPPTRVSDLELSGEIGDASGAAMVQYEADGSPKEYQTVVFRTGGIGGVVFVNRALGLETPVSVENVARVYANSILNPPAGCGITSVTALEGYPIPGFRFEAEGFYPWEGRMINLVDATQGGFATAKVGGGGESADRNGVIADTIFATVMVPSADMESFAAEAQEYTLSIVGTASGCKAEQTVFWPGAAAAPTDNVAPVSPGETSVPMATAASVPPSPTAIPGAQVFPVSSLESSIPWMPLDTANRPMTVYYGFNFHKPPFDNALVRQAFAAAIDKEQIAQEAKQFQFRELTPATTLTPSLVLGRDLYGEVGIPFDPGRARRLLEEAGYATLDSFPSPTLLVFMRGAAAPGAHFRLAQTVAAMWKTNLGIAVNVDTVESPTAAIARMQDHPAEIYLLNWGADYVDPDNFLKTLLHSGAEYNLGHYSSPTFDSIVDRAARLSDPAERQILYIQAEQQLTEQDAAVIPLFHTMYYSQP